MSINGNVHRCWPVLWCLTPLIILFAASPVADSALQLESDNIDCNRIIASSEAEQMPSGWYWPTGCSSVSDNGWLDPYDDVPSCKPEPGFHLAQDICSEQGQPVYSLADGRVIDFRTDVAGYGPNWTEGGALVAGYQSSDGSWFTALYGHLDNPHEKGPVCAGEILGYTNASNHLHFAIRPGYQELSEWWRGYTCDINNTYGFTDPVYFIESNHPAKNLIKDDSFEQVTGNWEVPDWGNNPTPSVSSATYHTGSYSVRLGTIRGLSRPRGDSALYQRLAIPQDASSATLSFWYWPTTADSSLSDDGQVVALYDSNGDILTVLMEVLENDRQWKMETYDLSAYRGQLVSVLFEVYQNGDRNPTGMYIDDVSVTYATTGSPPGDCSEDLGESEPNNSFNSAESLYCNATFPARICTPADLDYYRVVPNEGGTMTIMLKPPSDKDYDLYIYDASQQEMCSSLNGVGLDDSCSVSVTRGQTYFARVIGYAGAYSNTSSYGLEVSCTTAPTNNPPNEPTSLMQYKADAVTIIPFGGTTVEDAVILKGRVSDPDGDRVLLEVEIIPTGGDFTGNPTDCFSGVTHSARTAQAACTDLDDGAYEWRGRTKDSEGVVSDWVLAGNNATGQTDFEVDTSPVPPSITTSGPSYITSNSATLNATVIPNNSPTTVYFQWGTSTSYGNTRGFQSIGSGTSTISVSTDLSGLTPNTTYHFRAVATNGAGTTYGPDTVFTTNPPSGPKPEAPSNLEITSVIPNRITIAWRDNSNNEDGFRIERKESSVFVQIGNVGANVESFTEFVTPNTTYCYRVRAYNANGNSAYSNEDCVTTPPGDAGPFTLTAIPKCSSIGPAIRLEWTESENAASYQVYRNGSLLTVQTVQRSFEDNNVTTGTSYTYFVRAISQYGGQDTNSNTVTATPPSCFTDTGTMTKKTK